MDQVSEQKLKHNLEQVILESFDKAKAQKFKDLNFVFHNKGAEFKLIQSKIEILNNLDVYSKTFLSIHTRAKVALRELTDRSFKFEGASMELLRLVLTLSDQIGKKKSVKVKEKVPHEWDDYEVGEDLTKLYSSEEETKSEVKTIQQKKVKYLKEEETGHSISKKKNKIKRLTDLCLDIEL